MSMQDGRSFDRVVFSILAMGLGAEIVHVVEIHDWKALIMLGAAALWVLSEEWKGNV